MDELKEKKRMVLEYAKKGYQEKLMAGTSGNMSIYDREHGLMVITPSSVDYETMSLEDIMVITLDGEIVEGIHRPSSEWRMHSVIYREKTEVNSVVHTHSPFATSYAVSHEKIPVILVEMIPFLGGNIGVADFAFPGTPKVGEHALSALKERNGCLLANHGVLAVGPSLEKAYIRAVYIEDAARIYHYAKGNGQVIPVSEKDIQEILNRRKKKVVPKV